MRGRWRLFLAVVVISVPLAMPCVAQNSLKNATSDRADSQMEASVMRLLTRRCAGCHSGGEAKGQLDLTTREKQLTGGETGPALVPGQPDKSLVWQRVEQNEMPPKHPLPEEEKRVLKAWIEAGATWSGAALDPLSVSSEHRAGHDWWSLQPLARPRLPDAINGMRVHQPLDQFVLARLEDRGLKLSREADRRTLIRRLTFDLLGLPPSPEEVDAFVGDAAPDAPEKTG